MSRFLSVVILAGVFTIMSGAGAARAQSQAGGLPAVSDRVSALERIAVTLQSAVTTLQTQVTALQTSNTNLQNALNAETAARIAADTALQAAVTQEATTRSAGDTALQAAVTQEATTRKTADDSLRAEILASGGKAFSTFQRNAGLVQGARAVVGTVGPLPAGNYLLTAKATVENFIHDVDLWECDLQRDDGIFIDNSASSTTTGSPFTAIVNVGLTTLPTAQSVKMSCAAIGNISGSDVSDIAITAVPVGEATIGCPDIAFRCPGE